MSYFKHLTAKNILIAAGAIAAIGFLLMQYDSSNSFIGNVMYGRIVFSGDHCWPGFANDCFFVSYRSVLALDILLTAVALIYRNHR